MKGDKLVIEEGHVRAARQIMSRLWPQMTDTQGKFVVTVAGESGSGKSEIAATLSWEAVAERHIAFYEKFMRAQATCPSRKT